MHSRYMSWSSVGYGLKVQLGTHQLLDGILNQVLDEITGGETGGRKDKLGMSPKSLSRSAS